MAAIPETSSPRATGPFGTLVTAALVLLAAWLAAQWTWHFLAPPRLAAPAPAEGGTDLAAVARLFGGAPPAGGPAAGPSSGIRLKGVVAPTPASIGSAVFHVGGKDVAVPLGGELQPGVTLAEVGPDHAVLSRAGVRERIDLDTRMAAVPRPVAGRASGFRLNVSRAGANAFDFSRKELEEALRDPGQLAFLGRLGTPSGGGVRLDEAPPGSLASRLGLQPGDIVKRVNGQAVASAGDLARLHQQFATTSAIQAEIQRGSTTVQLSYTIRP